MSPLPGDPTTSSSVDRAVDWARPWTLIASLLVLTLALALGWGRMQPPRAAGLDAPSDTFSAGRALEILHGLLIEELPRPLASEQNARVRERIEAQLEELGYEVSVQETPWCGMRDADGACVLVAHHIVYDG
jgi:hypothetical protein